MGLDAESTDLTARIQRRRAALVAAGEVEPARPGEHRAFRGQPGYVPPPRTIPTRGAHRVVPVDETPTRGGAEALEEKGLVEDERTERDDSITPTGDGTHPLEGINEFGDRYGPDDDGGFDLGEAGQPYDPELDPELASPETAALQAQQMGEAPTQAKRKRTGSKRTALVAIDQLSDANITDHGEILSVLTDLRDALEPVLDYVADTSLHERLLAIEEGMLLLAEAVAQQTKGDASPDPEPAPRRSLLSRMLVPGG